MKRVTIIPPQVTIIPPQLQVDQMLGATIYEAIRVIRDVDRRLDSGKGFDDIPEDFRLGSGHITFFYNKLKYMNRLMKDCHDEYYARKNKVHEAFIIWRNRYESLRSYYPEEFKKLNNDWKPSRFDINIMNRRVAKRVRKMKSEPRYCGKRIDRKYYADNLMFPSEEPIKILAR